GGVGSSLHLGVGLGKTWRLVAAKAPERPASDQAKLSYDTGASALTSADALLKEEDYEKAIPGFQTAAINLGNALIGISKE
ncbi:hypothetical protein ACC754_42795, partial [Rhizobium johnstonii]